ncbi:MAG TPA: hypothetical protein VMG35_20825 [Bryobacteraceae bacterium]|nr:hypothetical protein [Bryobacteraceae bacterium]
MNTLSIVLIAVLIVLCAIIAWLAISRLRTRHLRSKFGPEYHRAVSEYGDRAKAERDLARREDRVQHLDIHPLPPATRDRYLQTWREGQTRFVDDPKGAVMLAEHLVTEVMRERGYPVAEFERRVEDISVDHPQLVQNYRAAREIMARQQHGEASTEDLRRALVHFRALFDELLETQEVSR